jgi:hypothetical protein
MSIIGEMSENPWLFAEKPAKDFSRKRKLDFETMLLLLLSMGGGSLQFELLEYTGYAIGTASASAFVQQRAKLLPFALEYILHQFTPPPDQIKRYEGYRLLATDGSDLLTLANPAEPENFFLSNPDSNGYNLLHLNAMYDLCNGLYTDALLQGGRNVHEHQALTAMVDRSSITGKAIVLADRGYEGYNNLAHIERKGWNYLFRVKDITGTGILRGLALPDTAEFDVAFHRVLTRKQTNAVKQIPSLYRFLPLSTTFDFLDLHENPFYPIDFRVVRFKITDDTYEVILTNLERDIFPPQKLKHLYNLRWGIETAFRSLKYSIGLLAFHSKKAAFISQEVFASLIMYNFCQMIASLAVIVKKNTLYVYQLNFFLAVRICSAFFRSRDPTPPDIEALLLAHLLPIRKGRSFPRNKRSSLSIGFNYRIA